MNSYNKALTFMTIAYFAVIICAIFNLFSGLYIKFALVMLFIPVVTMWVTYARVTKKIKLLYLKINELQKALCDANENVIRMKCQTESLSKDNDMLSEKLVKKHLSLQTNNNTDANSGDKTSGLVITNHSLFNELINKSISSSKRKDKIFALMIVSINKPDTYTIENDICSILRNEDIIAKLDDEIIILLSDIGKSKFASIVAEKILGIVKRINDNNAHNELTINIGICSYPDDGGSMESLFENAANALYKSIQTGKNTYEFYSQKLSIEAKEYIKLESALKNAITSYDLSLYYQPKLELKSATITGVEALMRWEHPVLGIITPDKFITIAEETGLFMKIAETALMDACVMNKSWQNEGLEHITVSVNISPKQFSHPDLPSLVSKSIASTGLNPAYLELEISEDTVMGDIESAKEILDKLKKIGVNISIDHFGTGFTSIRYLKKLPINTIKIDKNFIDGIPNNPNDMSITNAFIALAHNLGIQVVAEGVETAEQVQYLNLQHCDLIQGYFLSHPVHSTKISSQLKKLNEEVEI